MKFVLYYTTYGNNYLNFSYIPYAYLINSILIYFKFISNTPNFILYGIFFYISVIELVMYFRNCYTVSEGDCNVGLRNLFKSICDCSKYTFKNYVNYYRIFLFIDYKDRSNITFIWFKEP